MDWQGAIGIAVGALGVAISWWVAYGSWRERQPNLDISLAYGTLGVGQHALPVVWIRAVNRGAVDVEIEAIGLVAPGERRLMCEPSGNELRPGSVLHAGSGSACWLAPADIAEGLIAAGCIGTIELRAYCVDALGNERRSIPVPFEARTHRRDAASHQVMDDASR